MPVYLCQKRADWTELLEHFERENPGFKYFMAPRATDDLKLPEAAAYSGWSVSRLNRARRAWREAFPDDHIEIRTPRFEVQLLEKCTVSIQPFHLDRLKKWWEAPAPRPDPVVPPPGPFVIGVPVEQIREYGAPTWAGKTAR